MRWHCDVRPEVRQRVPASTGPSAEENCHQRTGECGQRDSRAQAAAPSAPACFFDHAQLRLAVRPEDLRITIEQLAHELSPARVKSDRRGRLDLAAAAVVNDEVD